MIDPRAVWESTDWESLTHAYGHAGDTGDLLLLIADEDPQINGEILGHLDAAILHQGGICTATAPVALFVAGVLPRPYTTVVCRSALPWDPRVRQLRAGLLEWLGLVADSANDPDMDSRALACREILPVLCQAVIPFVDDDDWPVRLAALEALASFLRAAELKSWRPRVAECLLRGFDDRPVPERVAVASLLGQWGMVPQRLLTDAVPLDLDDPLIGLAEPVIHYHPGGLPAQDDGRPSVALS